MEVLEARSENETCSGNVVAHVQLFLESRAQRGNQGCTPGIAVRFFLPDLQLHTSHLLRIAHHVGIISQLVRRPLHSRCIGRVPCTYPRRFQPCKLLSAHHQKITRTHHYSYIRDNLGLGLSNSVFLPSLDLVIHASGLSISLPRVY